MGKIVGQALYGAALVYLLYLGLHQGVEGAKNVALFLVWLAGIVGMLASLAADEIRKKQTGKRTPKSLFWAVALAVLGMLLWHGYIVTAVFWLIGKLCAAAILYEEPRA